MASWGSAGTLSPALYMRPNSSMARASPFSAASRSRPALSTGATGGGAGFSPGLAGGGANVLTTSMPSPTATTVPAAPSAIIVRRDVLRDRAGGGVTTRVVSSLGPAGGRDGAG